ncbi:MAG: CDP-alcohol phosphatidyltransferase family protein [Thermodesulfobacteriota bacterium]
MAVTIPNIITLIRLLLIPVFIITMQNHGFTWALSLFAVAAISDALDGFLARMLNQRTSIGAMIDPIADKLLVVSAFTCLSIMGITPSWLTVIVISRDVVILLGYGVLRASDVRIAVKPSIISKCNTCLQFFTISGELFRQVRPAFIPEICTDWLYGGTALLTVVSGFHYIYIGVRTDSRSPAP